MGGGLGPVGALAGPCNTETKDCGPPRIEIFGGGGIGAVANAVINETGQVVGANMKNLGVGYTEAPYVAIIDDCDNGRGATGTPVVEDGQITNIIVTNTGGGYLGAGDSEGVDVIGEVENIQVVSELLQTGFKVAGIPKWFQNGFEIHHAANWPSGGTHHICGPHMRE